MEFDDELNLNQYDFGARSYDPAIARWTCIDPMADAAPHWTPFRYAYNNPITVTDYSGMLEGGTDWENENEESTENNAKQSGGTVSVASTATKTSSNPAGKNLLGKIIDKVRSFFTGERYDLGAHPTWNGVGGVESGQGTKSYKGNAKDEIISNVMFKYIDPNNGIGGSEYNSINGKGSIESGYNFDEGLQVNSTISTAVSTPTVTPKQAGSIAITGAIAQDVPVINWVSNYITGYTIGMNIESFTNGVANFLIYLGVSESTLYGPTYDSFAHKPQAQSKGLKKKTGGRHQRGLDRDAQKYKDKKRTQTDPNGNSKWKPNK